MPRLRAACGRSPAPTFSRRLLALAFFVLCTGCWQTRQGPDPPDLTTQNQEVDLTIERLMRLGTTMDEELTELRGRTDAFFDAPADTWRAPFPLDAFKHAAMSCLNAPYNEAEPEPVVKEAAERLGIMCAVPAALELERRMAETPEIREPAMAGLLQIDGLRSVRAKLQSRLRQLPSILRRTRAYLVTRRAEARQIIKDLQSRKNEYSRKSFDDAMRIVDDYEQRLAELDRQIGALEESTGRWSNRLDAIVEVLYLELSRLGRP